MPYLSYDDSPPKYIDILTMVFCFSGPNFGIPSLNDWCGQAQNGDGFRY